MELKKGDTVRVTACIPQLREIGVPDNYSERVLIIEGVRLVGVEYCCITECGWLIPVNHVQKL